MLFEVIGADGKCKMSTKYPSCIYDEDILRHMAKVGYTFRVDGKRAGVDKVMELKFPNGKPKPSASPVLKTKYIIECVDTGEKFNKQSEAAKRLGIDPAAVSDSIKTGRPRAGYTFRKVEAE